MNDNLHSLEMQTVLADEPLPSISEAPWIESPVADPMIALEREAVLKAVRLVPLLLLGGIGLGLMLPTFIHGDLIFNVRVMECQYLIAYGCLAAAFVLKTREVVLKASIDERQFEKSPDRKSQWHVAVNVVADALVTGKDRGVLWVDGDTLYFSGNVTSFALARGLVDDLKPLTIRHRVFWPMQRKIALKLNPSFTDGRRSVEIDLSGAGPDEAAFQSLVGGISRFCDRNQGRCAGQLPPMSMGPGAFSRSDLARALVLATFLSLGTALLAGGAAFFVEMLLWTGSNVLPPIAAALAALSWPDIGLCRRAMKTRKRLAGSGQTRIGTLDQVRTESEISAF